MCIFQIKKENKMKNYNHSPEVRLNYGKTPQVLVITKIPLKY